MCHEKGSDQLIVKLYALSIYPSVHNQLICTHFEAHCIDKLGSKNKYR